MTVEDRLHKYKKRYLKYSIKKSKSNRLVIIFSGVDASPGSCRMSYYSLKDKIDANVVHIMDDIGSHGCYLLSVAGDFQIRNVVLSLLRDLQKELDIDKDDIYFIGTSKGGTSAIAYSLIFGGGKVLAGEPQILLGDFIYSEKWEQLEQFRSLGYVMTGRVAPEIDRDTLNKYMDDIISRYGAAYSGQMLILSGEKTGYLARHVSPFMSAVESAQMSKISVKVVDIDFHDQIVDVFLDECQNIFEAFE